MDRFQYGFCEWSIKERGEELCKIVSSAGLTCLQVGVGPETLQGKGLADPALVDEYIRAAEKYGLDICCVVPTALDFYSYTRPDSAEEEEIALKIVNRTIDLCKAFGCKGYLLPALNRGNIVDGPSFHKAVENIKRFVDRAADLGVMTLFESVLGVKQTWDVIHAVDHPMFRLFFDSQNTYIYDGTYAAGWFKELQDYIMEIHVKDGVGTALSASLLGEGTSGFYNTAQAIRESNYKGNILLENYYQTEPLCYQGDTMDLIAKDLATMKHVFPNN